MRREGEGYLFANINTHSKVWADGTRRSHWPAIVTTEGYDKSILRCVDR